MSEVLFRDETKANEEPEKKERVVEKAVRHEQLAFLAFKRVDLFISSDKWLTVQTGEISIWQMQPKNEPIALKLVSNIYVSHPKASSQMLAQLMFDYFLNPVHRLAWDDTIGSMRTEKEFSPHLSIGYSVFNPVLGGLVSARDTVDLAVQSHVSDNTEPTSPLLVDVEDEHVEDAKTLAQRYQNRLVSVITAIDFPVKNPAPNVVRAHNHGSGIVVERLDENDPVVQKSQELTVGCCFTFFMQVDLKGNLPTFAVNRAMPGQIRKTFLAFKQYTLKTALNTFNKM